MRAFSPTGEVEWEAGRPASAIGIPGRPVWCAGPRSYIQWNANSTWLIGPGRLKDELGAAGLDGSG